MSKPQWRSALDSEVQTMTEKENAAVQRASLSYSINMLRLLLPMQLVTEEPYSPSHSGALRSAEKDMS